MAGALSQKEQQLEESLNVASWFKDYPWSGCYRFGNGPAAEFSWQNENASYLIIPEDKLVAVRQQLSQRGSVETQELAKTVILDGKRYKSFIIR